MDGLGGTVRFKVAETLSLTADAVMVTVRAEVTVEGAV
jgi:hypothetical protein